MKNAEVENNEEVKKLKKKYKKLRNCIIIPIIIVILLAVIVISYNSLMIRKILKNNLSINFGDNYKFTTVNYTFEKPEEKVKSVVCHKDGIVSVVLQNGKYGMLKDKDTTYQIMYETKEYRTLENGLMMGDNNNSLLNYFMIGKEDVDSFWKIAEMVYRARVMVGNAKEDGNSYYIINFIGFDEKIYVNKENYLIEKNVFEDRVMETIMEKGVVTDEDIMLPQDRGFTDITEKDLTN